MEPPGDSILDATQLTFGGSFERQVNEIMTKVRLTRYEVENLQCLLNDLEDALYQIWPGCRVYPFGSIITGLGIKTSDIDCFIEIPPECKCGKINAVNRARNVLRKDPKKFSQLFAITSAKVPILKFVHRPTCFNCDISFSSFNGVRNSTLIAFLLNLDRRALHLAIIVKYWSKVYNFTGTNLMPSYALTLMVIFYLQAKSILPSVAQLQRSMKPVLVDNWNTAFNDEIVYEPHNTESLHELLGDFFNYYKKFNFEQYVISPFLGCPLNKQIFADPNKLPCEYSLYKMHISSKICKPIRLDSPICVQDPFEHSRNCSVAVFKRLFHKIHAHFVLAAKFFNEKPSKDFLKALLNMDPKKGTTVAAKINLNIKNKIIKKKYKQTQATARAREYFNVWKMENKGNVHKGA